MEILVVDFKTYQDELKCYSIFNSVVFAQLNKSKVDEIIYIIFRDSKVRLGIILGRRGNEICSPFSAPYGGFIYNDEDCKASIIDEAIIALDNWMIKEGFSKLSIALPPLHYNPQFLTRVVNGLHNRSYNLSALDVNHHFDIPNQFEESYRDLLQRNARKNLKNALKHNFIFHHLDSGNALRAYNIISVNRVAKQKPLRLTLEQVLEVSGVTTIDFFVVAHDGIDLAAAIVFGINDNLAQVVYWGDDPHYAELRSMNFLTYKVFEFYARKGIKTLDIGISTENSIPNYGLCEFKESIGCAVSLKYSFSKVF
jgi:hypothetical protein